MLSLELEPHFIYPFHKEVVGDYATTIITTLLWSVGVELVRTCPKQTALFCFGFFPQDTLESCDGGIFGWLPLGSSKDFNTSFQYKLPEH